MKTLARLLWFALLVTLIVVFATLIPEGGWLGEAGKGSAGFNLIDFARAGLDPVVLLLATGATVLVGRWRGIRAAFRFLLGSGVAITELSPASKTLAACGRGLLWGSFAANAAYIISFYWPQAPTESIGFLANSARFDYLKLGGLFAVVVGALVLLPCAARAAELAGSSGSKANRISHSIDALALLGLLACIWVLILGIFLYRAPLIDAGDTSVAPLLLRPTLDGVGWPLLVWSVGLTVLLPLLALAPLRTSLAGGPGGALHSFGRLCLASGVLGAILIETSGLNRIARSGGNADPMALQAVVGHMLVPTLLGLLGLIATQCWSRRALPAPIGTAATG